MRASVFKVANVVSGFLLVAMFAIVIAIAKLGEPGEYPGLAYSSCFAIVLLAVVDLWRKRFWAGTVCGAALSASLLLLAMEVIVADDLRSLTLQLSIPEPEPWRKEASGAAHSVKVLWSEFSDGGWNDRPWELDSTGATHSFHSSTKVRVGSHHGYLVSHSAWYFVPSQTILIVVDEAHCFRFDPDDLFAIDKAGTRLETSWRRLNSMTTSAGPNALRPSNFQRLWGITLCDRECGALAGAL